MRHPPVALAGNPSNKLLIIHSPSSVTQACAAGVPFECIHVEKTSVIWRENICQFPLWLSRWHRTRKLHSVHLLCTLTSPPFSTFPTRCFAEERSVTDTTQDVRNDDLTAVGAQGDKRQETNKNQQHDLPACLAHSGRWTVFSPTGVKSHEQKHEAAWSE